MKFYIDSKTYNLRKENKGSFLLMVNKTNQTMMLNASTMKLFKETDKWLYLTEFIDALGIKSVSRERLWNDYSSALYKLHVNGVCRITDWQKSEESGASVICRIC